jgi:ribonuclease P protein component
MRFRSEQHLRRQDDIRAAREQGNRIDCGAFTIWWRLPAGTQPESLPRVGVVASIAAVGPSVQRSRVKRRLRELFRLQQSRLPRGCDLLLVARAAVNRWQFPELEKKFIEACGKIATAAAARK